MTTQFPVGDYTTRDGRRAKVLLVDERRGKFALLGAVESGGRWLNETWDSGGFRFGEGVASENDLMPPKKSVTVHVRVYPNAVCTTTSNWPCVADNDLTEQFSRTLEYTPGEGLNR